MGIQVILPTRLVALIILHAAGAGLASPTVMVTRPTPRMTVDWLPMDNQTIYILQPGEKRSFELNTSSISEVIVYITISPCSPDLTWSLYHGDLDSGFLKVLKENQGGDISTVSLVTSKRDRYVLQLSSTSNCGAAVSVRGEPPRQVRMRLRVRSRRRLAANWDFSPIDPKSTTYCVVASHRKNYTSLCAAQYDMKKRFEPNSTENDGSKIRTFHDKDRSGSAEVDNKIEIEPLEIYEGNSRNVYTRRKKFGRSTKVSDKDPVITCVGDRTHHIIENLDPRMTYYVSVFGVSKDRRAGTLLASSSIKPRSSTAKRLQENVPTRSDVRGKTVYYFKAVVGSGGGLWLAVSTCGGPVDVEVMIRGKRLYFAKNIDPYSKFFVPAPIPSSSIQDTSDEGSVQFDSSSEESRMRYVIKVLPSRRRADGGLSVELTASTSRWGIGSPELMEDGAIVRELRPRRSCRSVEIAFLPAQHNITDVIRYCIAVSESSYSEMQLCLAKRSTAKLQCFDHSQRDLAKVLVQKISGLKSGRKYAIQVTAISKQSSVPYNVLYVDTNVSCI